MESSIYKKLLDIQKQVGGIKKDSKNPFYNSKYFDINAVLAVIKPVLNEVDLVLTQALNVVEGRTALNTTIKDSGTLESVQSNCLLPEGLDAQKMGSAITYLRRYSIQTLLALEAVDDDGNVAIGNLVKTPTPGGYGGVKNPNEKVDKFMQDIEPTGDEIMDWQIKLENAKTLKELHSLWKMTPPMVQNKLEMVKNQLKIKLGGKATN